MLVELEKILNISWTKDTCYPQLQNIWRKNNPSIGQCAITALIINDYLGGKIMKCTCNGISHYYNFINDKIVDLTATQFENIFIDYSNSEEISRENILYHEKASDRYKQLLSNVENNFMKYGEKEYTLIDECGNSYKSKIPGTVAGNKREKIYGKFDCYSALRYIEKGMYIKNRVFFKDEETALQAGYRPCGVCMKEKYNIWKRENSDKRLIISKKLLK